jgi:myo-inositol 2-dehydrogenase/D-chiro-inositol 1-dehydrogenase
VRITARDPEPPSPAYLEGRGPETIFVDTASHDLDLVRFVTGEDIVEVSARGSALLDTGSPGMVDTSITTAVTASGALAAIDNTWRSSYGYDQRLEVHGTDGTSLALNERNDTTTFADGAGFHLPPPPYFFLDRYAESFVAELESFAAALDGAPVAVTGRDGRAALAAAQAAAQSAAESRIVRLDELG